MSHVKKKGAAAAFANSKCPGPSCSKLTMSLVNDSLKFTLNAMQIC